MRLDAGSRTMGGIVGFGAGSCPARRCLLGAFGSSPAGVPATAQSRGGG